MRARTLLLCLAMIAGSHTAQAREPAPDTARELERLSSERAVDRERAQNWLAVHLTPTDQRAVATAARDGDAETRRRLVGALADADRHLELIVALCDDTGQPARDLGRQALTALARRWLPGLDDPPISTEDLLAQREEVAAAVFSLPARHETIAERIESIALETDLGLPIVVTPELLEQDRVALQPALEGTALELLDATVREAGLSLAGVGDHQEEAGPALLVVDRRGRARRESGFERLEEWCLAVRRGDEHAERAGLALAGSGWPAALAWLETRALKGTPGPTRDAALEGLLAAARLGLVAPGLCRQDTREKLVRLGDARLASSHAVERRKGAGVARAIAELGARTPDGEDCSAVLLDGWELADSDARHWLRLVAIEGQRPSDERLVAMARQVAEDAERPPQLRLQALRAVAALGGTGVRLDDDGVRRLWTHAAANGDDAELTVLVGAVAEAPTTRASDGARSFAEPRYAAFLASWALRSGAREAALAAWRAEARDGFDSEPRFDAWLGAAEDARSVLGVVAARALLDEALGESAPDAARRFAVQARLLTPEESRAVALELAEVDEPNPGQWSDLGALAAGPASASVREALVAGLERGRASDARALVEACELAAAVLRGARRDLELRRLQQSVWKAVRPPTHPLHERLGPGRFPARVELVAQPLGYRLRRFEG